MAQLLKSMGACERAEVLEVERKDLTSGSSTSEASGMMDWPDAVSLHIGDSDIRSVHSRKKSRESPP